MSYAMTRMEVLKSNARIISCLANDISMVDIANRIGISRDYLDTKLSRMRRKSGVKSNTALVAKAFRMGVIS